MADPVYMLVKGATGRDEKKRKNEPCIIKRGELLVEIPSKERIVLQKGIPPHNYRLLHDPGVTLYDNGVNIIPLVGAEADYLEGIQDRNTRIVEYGRDDHLQWIMDLRTGDVVYFRLERSKAPQYVLGKIRYYGKVEGRAGVMFGIEIMDPEHKGKGNSNGHPYFWCNHNDGVFVSMDKIVRSAEQSSATSSSKPSNSNNPATKSSQQKHPGNDVIKKEPMPGDPPAHSMHNRNKTDTGWISKTYNFISGGELDQELTPEPVPIELLADQGRFTIGDRVVVQNVQGKPITGTVMWVGPLKAAGKTIVPVAIGIETDRPVDRKNEFPDTHFDITGSRGQHLFKIQATKNHGRLFLPEPLVLHADEYARQRQEEDTPEVREAKKWGLSVDEYKGQFLAMKEVAPTKEKEYDIRVNEQEEDRVVGVGNLNDSLFENLDVNNGLSKQTIEAQQREFEKLKQQLVEEKYESPLDHPLRAMVQQQSALQPDYLTQMPQMIEPEEKIAFFEAINARISAENQMAVRRIDDLQAENNRIKHENGKMKEENSRIKDENSKIKDENNRIKDENNRIMDEKIGVINENIQLKTAIDQMRNELAAVQDAKNTGSLTDVKYWSVSHKQIRTTGEKLGDGGWGKVEVGFFHGQKVAVKMLHSDIVSPHYNSLVKREVAMMVKVRHPSLLLCVGAVLDHPSGSPIIITELMDTSLRKAYKDGILDYRMKLCILRDTASALDYLHCHPDVIIHRDVSSANVLLECRGHNKWRAKLSDFGSANIARLSNTAAPGAAVYTAPEVPGSQTSKMDVYSYGVMTCELLTNQFPFAEAFPSMLDFLLNKWELMYKLVVGCTKTNISERSSMADVLGVLYNNYYEILNQ